MDIHSNIRYSKCMLKYIHRHILLLLCIYTYTYFINNKHIHTAFILFYFFLSIFIQSWNPTIFGHSNQIFNKFWIVMMKKSYHQKIWMWLRYVNNIFHKLDAKTEYLLTEMILYEGYDGKKLKQKGFMKSHPSRLPRISSLYILEALVSEFLL